MHKILRKYFESFCLNMRLGNSFVFFVFYVHCRKYIITPSQSNNSVGRPLSPNYINDNYIKKPEQIKYNYETMDETDHPKSTHCVNNALNNTIEGQSSNDSGGDDVSDGGGGGVGSSSGGGACDVANNANAAKSVTASGGENCGNQKRRLSRPGQAIQIRTDSNGTRTIDHEGEVGVCKISTITLSPDNKSLEKKIEYISDNQLDKLTNGAANDIIDHNDHIVGKSIESLSVECLPSTTKRTQHDLIQFVFTSHGIRVISDKEYVV